MFSQWRQAVESLAQVPSQHSPKPSQDASGPSAPRSSTDSLRQPSAQPTDLAISNLKKSLSVQRPVSPTQARTPEQAAGRSPGHRVTLEDRLRAKFTIGDASNSPSPNPSVRPSRASTPVTDHPLSTSSPSRPQSPATTVEARRPLSPTSAPLPDSPALSSLQSPGESIPPYPIFPPLEPLATAPLSTSVVEMLANAELETESRAPFREDSSESPRAARPPSPEETPFVGCVDVPQSHANVQVGPALNEEDNNMLVEEAEHIEPPSSPQTLLQPTLEHSISRDAETPEAHSRVTSDSHVDNIGVTTLTEGSPDVAATPPDLDVAPEHVEQSLNNVTQPSLGVRDGAKQDDPPVSSVPPLSPFQLDEPDIEGLQKRLKLVEQRFSDVSTSFKRLQAEKTAADRVLRELTPLESIHDADILSDYFQNMNLKTEMAQDEIRRLTGKLTRQEERIEELRDTHKLESKSQSDQIERLRAQIGETEALLKASQSANAEVMEESSKYKLQFESLVVEVENLKTTGKEEEEKRVKAVALLKTVRQKLVKAEKERDDVSKELQSWKDKERDEREKERVERQKLLAEVEKVNHERETAVVGLRAQFDKEISTLKERHEREQLALRGQFELEAVTMKATYSRDIDAKVSRISQLESSVQTLRAEKDELFDQLQMRQAELESSQHLLESLQSQSTEFQFQHREASERISLLQEELAETRRSHVLGVQGSNPPSEEMSQLLLGAEVKYESRVADLRRQLSVVERERDEVEAEWSRKLNDRLKEIETLKLAVAESTSHEKEEEERMTSHKKQINQLREELRLSQTVISDLREQAGKVVDVEIVARTQLGDANVKIDTLQQQLEDIKSREAQLRTNNKTLRDELRKVQSSAALLERQRNPGVGYWAARPENGSDVRSPRSSVSDLPSQNSPSSRPGSPAPAKSDEEVNFEYLRNVILQFLENKEMRPHLVRILSTILHFTPQETRRLVSKV